MGRKVLLSSSLITIFDYADTKCLISLFELRGGLRLCMCVVCFLLPMELLKWTISDVGFCFTLSSFVLHPPIILLCTSNKQSYYACVCVCLYLFSNIFVSSLFFSKMKEIIQNYWAPTTIATSFRPQLKTFLTRSSNQTVQTLNLLVHTHTHIHIRSGVIYTNHRAKSNTVCTREFQSYCFWLHARSLFASFFYVYVFLCTAIRPAYRFWIKISTRRKQKQTNKNKNNNVFPFCFLYYIAWLTLEL